MYKRILAAIDWTPGTETVLNHTRQLAMLTGATVHVLHVQAMNFPSPPSVLGHMASHALACEPETPDPHSVAHRMVDDAVAALTSAGVHAEGTLLESAPGNTSRAVLEQVRDLDAELIVLGSRHHGWPSTLFRSSVADEVSRHAQCPILIVP